MIKQHLVVLALGVVSIFAGVAYLSAQVLNERQSEFSFRPGQRITLSQTGNFYYYPYAKCGTRYGPEEKTVFDWTTGKRSIVFEFLPYDNILDQKFSSDFVEYLNKKLENTAISFSYLHTQNFEYHYNNTRNAPDILIGYVYDIKLPSKVDLNGFTSGHGHGLFAQMDMAGLDALSFATCDLFGPPLAFVLDDGRFDHMICHVGSGYNVLVRRHHMIECILRSLGFAGSVSTRDSFFSDRDHRLWHSFTYEFSDQLRAVLNGDFDHGDIVETDLRRIEKNRK